MTVAGYSCRDGVRLLPVGGARKSRQIAPCWRYGARVVKLMRAGCESPVWGLLGGKYGAADDMRMLFSCGW